MCRWMLLMIAAAVMLCQATNGFSSSLIHKNYVVRYDRGWDILCEPYVVQKTDSIIKIFRQKGEIAHRDYADFLDIFKRLNPHIRNVDLIRPGQGIDIPLRKLEQGILPGQSSGVITITFVTLRDVADLIKKHSTAHTVQKGDMVSLLIGRKYGSYGSKPYQEGIKLFQAANPEVTNLGLIHVGQKLSIPDPAIRRMPWYANMFDAQGDLREKVDQDPHRPTVEAKPATEPRPIEPAAGPELVEDIENLTAAAQCLGGILKTKGTFYLPLEDTQDFELNLSKHPVLELGSGPKLVFTPHDKIMNLAANNFQSNWPAMKAVIVDSAATTEQYVGAIFDAIDEDSRSAEPLTIKKQGVRITVKAKYIRTEDKDRHLCITPIATADQQTPASMRRYLEQNGIVLREIISNGSAICSNHNDTDNPKAKNILPIKAKGQKEFVQQLAANLNLNYTPNTSITFPYAGFQVEAYGNLLSTKSGRESLIDFGNLYGGAVAAIKQTGLNVVQIKPEDSYNLIAQKVLTALSINFEQHPTLLAAKRPAEFNTAIRISGVLLKNQNNRRVLLTNADLHPALTKLLDHHDINVIAW